MPIATIEEPVVWTVPKPEELLVQADDLRNLVAGLYVAVGVPEADAERMAELQVETDVRGVHSHGTRALPGYINRIQSGHTNPTPSPKVIKDGPAYAMVDADNGLGHLGSSLGMQIAIEKASTAGVSTVGVVNSRHFGAAACYSTMALEQGMVGFCVSSSSQGLAPYGGVERLLGNHAVAYAVPADKEYPLVLDMATGVSAWGRIGTMRMYGKRLTMDWVLGEDGHPTDDPARGYALLPFGGVKGSGLTMMMDVLSGVLPFGLATINRGEAYAGQRMASHFFYAVKIDNFIPLDEFTAEVDRMVQAVRNSRREEGVERIYLPGEIEWLKQAAWSKSGIPLHRQHVERLSKLAEELSVSIPW